MLLRHLSLAALSTLLAGGAVFPAVDRWRASADAQARLADVGRAGDLFGRGGACLPSPHLGQERAPLLASWQSVGGCGAGATTGAGASLKWVGRNVSGGLFNVQCQASYTALTGDPLREEHHYQVTTTLTKELSERWTAGVAVPVAYKYLRDPHGEYVDLSNSGLGDLGVLLVRKLGPINATALTASVSLPSGTHDVRYKMKYLKQHQQLGFGKVAGSLGLDHTLDETWGLIVLGGSAGWRGGENRLGNYRAATGNLYGHVGAFAGPLVPALGLSVAGFTGHDRDRTQPEYTALYEASATFSVEWATDWVAIIAGGSLPYRYDGFREDSDGHPRNPWGWGPWSVSLGASFAPF